MSTMQIIDKPKTNQTSAKALRSGSFPGISLPTAIERAKELWVAEKKNSVPINSATTCWGYSEKSSGGKIAVAALINFGLLDASGSSEERRIKLSERAICILFSPDEASKKKAITEAAKAPKIYREIMEKFKDDLPSDSTLNYHLISRDFNPNATKAFIKNLRETISFANLTSSDNMSSEEQENDVNEQYLDGDIVMGSDTEQRVTQIPNVQRDTFLTKDGLIVLQCPSKLTPQTFERFKAWLELQVLKISDSVTIE